MSLPDKVVDALQEAQYSLPFAVAVALVRGTIGVEEVTQSGLSDPIIRAIAQSIVITETDGFNAVFPEHRIARAILKLKDGRVLTSAATEAKGDPESRFSDAVIWSKYQGLTVPVIGQDKADKLEHTIRALPVEGDVAGLFKLLAG